MLLLMMRRDYFMLLRGEIPYVVAIRHCRHHVGHNASPPYVTVPTFDAIAFAIVASAYNTPPSPTTALRPAHRRRHQRLPLLHAAAAKMP